MTPTRFEPLTNAFASRRALVTGGLGLASAMFAGRSMAQDATPQADTANEASREVLNTGFPAVVPGSELTMTRVTIPVGVTVSAHYHPGMQLVYIQSGTVHYTVVSGELPYSTAGASGAAGDEGILGAGEALDFGPGDRLTELPGMVHVAENRGSEPTVILTASLFPNDLPPSIPVDQSRSDRQ